MRNNAIALAVFVVMFLYGCAGMAEYLGPPPGATGNAARPVDPESLRVDPKEYPTFRVTKAVTPPQPKSDYIPESAQRTPMVQILPSDEWHVRYKWGDLFLITSESYDQRQCDSQRNMGPGIKCAKALFKDRYEPQYFYSIYIDINGRISGGWKLVANPTRIVLASERRTYFNPNSNPNSKGNVGWEEVSFEPIR